LMDDLDRFFHNLLCFRHAYFALGYGHTHDWYWVCFLPNVYATFPDPLLQFSLQLFVPA
jgi:hypothetical protein